MDQTFPGSPPSSPASISLASLVSGHAPHTVPSSSATNSSPRMSPPRQSGPHRGRSQLNAASDATVTEDTPPGGPQPQTAPPPAGEVPGEATIEELKQRAKNGDSKAQTEIGRYYLRLSEVEHEEANSVTAVTWLLLAARNGRRDAVKLLQWCLHEQKGITAENREEVHTLACESRFERSVRKAALCMYRKLNPERKRRLTSSELLENINQVDTETDGARGRLLSISAQKQRKVLESLVSSDGTQCIGVEEFVENTKRYAQGISPTPALEAEVVNEDDDEEPVKNPDELPLQQKILKFPLHAVTEVKEVLIDWASRAGMQWISALIPTHHVNTLIFFFIISNLTLDFFLLVIPLIIFYFSFLSMVICTLRVFQNSKAWENFKVLTAMLAHFEPGLDLEQAETNFTWTHLEPHLHFLLSALFLILSFPVADESWLPCSELATVAIFFTASSYLSLRPAAQQHAKLALLTQVSSAVCSFAHSLLGGRLGWLGWLVGGSWFSLPICDWLVLHVGLPCLLYLCLLYLCVRMAVARGLHGSYSVLLPYMVCFVWCEMSVSLLHGSTALGLMRTAVGYLLFFFALPVLSLAVAAMLLVQVAHWFLALDLAKMAVTACVCALPVLLRWWTRFSVSPLALLRSLRRSSIVKLILVWISALLLFSWFYVYRSEGMKVYNSTLTWHQYGELCGPHAWKERNMAHTQILCSHLEGHRVTWEGRFKYVRVTEIENGAQAVVNLLPGMVADWVRCLYGEEYPACNSTETGPVGALCQLKALANHKCHVKRFDRYKFEVTMGMPHGDKKGKGTHEMDDGTKDIVLRASNEFRGVLLALNAGSVVEFSTVLEGRLGSKWPVFELKALHCRTCMSTLVPARRLVKIEQDWRINARTAFAFAFNFLFHPLLTAEVGVTVATEAAV
ncbi:wolframin isoform X2 [Brachyhypopomus gauderio]|uniref:wolframin isoform X2 n=1 Tax=Brachyhypopomus gauderio TaxID=698409 RepID=UPI004043051D